ncbi:outer membrane protein assembly factor BamA [Balneicella halophila]|nr:outer membrane protein assembly factor BamA [Balneicella halophila]
MIKKIGIILVMIFAGAFAWAQDTDTIYNLEVDYNAPVIYEVAALKVEGVKHLDKEVIKQLLRISVGDKLQVPGDDISLGIKRLYRQGLFSDIKLIADKVVGNQIYLTLEVEERPQLTTINFTGIKSSEEKKLIEKTALSKGGYFTANLKNRIKLIVQNYYKEKGFNNVGVTFEQTPDPDIPNAVGLKINIDKNKVVKVRDIIITGNDNLSDHKLIKAMKKTKEKNWRYFFRSKKFSEKEFKNDRVLLIEKYNEFGYRDAKIESYKIEEVEKNRINIHLDIDEGNRYYFNDIQWVGNTVYSSDFLTRVLKISKGDIYNKKLLDDRISNDDDAVSNLYFDNGYLFSRMIPKEIVKGKDSIDLEISVIEGQQATINKVIITGNDRTHEHVIRRELWVYPGDLFSKTKIIRSIRELANLGLFDPEQLQPDIQPDPENGTADIVIPVVEKPSDQIELSGGYGGGTVIASVGLKFSNFSIRNIFNKEAWQPLPTGDGQTLSLRIQSNGKYYSQYSFSFIEPWFGGKKPNSFSVGGYMSNQTRLSSSYAVSSVNPGEDQQFRVWGASIGLGRRLNWPDNYFTLSNSLSFQRYELENWGGFYQFTNGSSNLLSLSTTLARRSIDNPIYTRSGSDFSIGLQFTPPYSLFNDTDYSALDDGHQDKFRWVEFHKWTFKGKIYTPLSRDRKLVLYTGTEYGFLGYYDKDKRSPFEGYSVGGDGMSGYTAYGSDVIGVRGYENNSLTPIGEDGRRTTGNLYGKMTMELRYPLSLEQSATIYVLGFAEAGNSWYDFEDFQPFNMYRSAGVGVRIFLPMFGLLGIDWGYGFDDVPNQPGASGAQFHFILGQQF